MKESKNDLLVVYEHAVRKHDDKSLGQHAHYNADSTGNWFEFE